MSLKLLGTATLALLAASAASAASPLAPFTLSATSYTQDFNTLDSSTPSPSQNLPAGFQIAETNGTGTGDDRYVASTGGVASVGAANAGGIYSFGLAGDPDRALGSVGSGGVAPNYFGGIFTNGTGATITALSFAYTGEQWRYASNAADMLTFDYLAGASAINAGSWTNVSQLTFNAPRTGAATEGALNGNLAANRTALAYTVTGLSIANGTTFGFRWVDQNSLGNDQGLGVDDLQITATLATAAATVPEPATWASFVAGFGLLGLALRRRRVAAFA